ncbi:MAG: FkbM family methyltransferase [Capsulimonadales bacterium]|nr:FkbM family methyltransferase [Capsulimonadales bacterium]
MGLKRVLGTAYRQVFKSLRHVGVRRLPVRVNSEWTVWPVEMWDGLRFDHEDYMANALRQRLSPGMGFADIGAHFGIWSGVAARLVGPEGKVVAAEPSPAFDMLSLYLKDRRNVILNQVAVGSKEGTTSFVAQGNTMSGAVVGEVTKINEKMNPGVPLTEITVSIVTLDSLLSAYNVPRWLIKIDVEGYEAEVLRGATNLLKANHTDWIVEIHPKQMELSGSRDTDISDIFTSHGYEVRTLHRNPNTIYTITASRPQGGGGGK